jgi:D-alanyl-D-alanine carboxypeptidase (penicillin-binding protein 5/6)
MCIQVQSAKAMIPFDIEAESAILIEAKTGKILFQKNEDIQLPPASMSKMMTEYLVLEAINNGQFNWDTVVRASSYVHYLGGLDGTSRVWMADGEERTVEELYTALAVYSANDATAALAELVAGTEASFVQLMNQKAYDLGMNNTRFVNSTGLPNLLLGDYIPAGTPEEENLMSARDTAILARELVNNYPDVLRFSSIPEKPAEYFNGVRMINWNWMLEGHPLGEARSHAYSGLDGLKTGYTNAALNCFTGTAERNGMRLISVVMRSETKASRFQETRKLMDYGFNNFIYKEMAKAGDTLPEQERFPIAKGIEKDAGVVLGGSILTVVHKDEVDLYKLEHKLNQNIVDETGALLAPLHEDDEIGEVHLTYTGELAYGFIHKGDNPEQTTLVMQEAVEKASWFRLFMRSIIGFFSGIWVGITDGIKGWFS